MLSVLAGAAVLALIGGAANRRAELREQAVADARERAKEKRARDERKKQEEERTAQRVEEVRRQTEEQRAREERTEERRLRLAHERMARWEPRMRRVFAVNAGGRKAFVGRVIAVDEEGVVFRDGSKAEMMVKYVDLQACPVKSANLKNSAAWIFPVQPTSTPENEKNNEKVVDLDDTHP